MAATATLNRSATEMDADLQRTVMEALKWEPTVHPERIGVAVLDGVVTLSGNVDTFLEKFNAERAAKRVPGVRAVVNDIVVKPPEITDEDVAREAVKSLKWNLFVPADKIKVAVSQGWVTLEGEVRWHFQREAAEDAVRYVDGVRGITNRIRVKSKDQPERIRERIEEALKRAAGLDASRITVDVDGRTVTLRGMVSTLEERDNAERVAWRAPGVERVENLIIVEPR
jgi:osmotically-inducible protein OsmY